MIFSNMINPLSDKIFTSHRSRAGVRTGKTPMICISLYSNMNIIIPEVRICTPDINGNCSGLEIAM